MEHLHVIVKRLELLEDFLGTSSAVSKIVHPYELWKYPSSVSSLAFSQGKHGMPPNPFTISETIRFLLIVFPFWIILIHWFSDLRHNVLICMNFCAVPHHQLISTAVLQVQWECLKRIECLLDVISKSGDAAAMEAMESKPVSETLPSLRMYVCIHDMI